MASPNHSDLYDETYFQQYSSMSYDRVPHWLQFFSGIADRIVRGIGPVSVLDAGCAKGFLVEALRDRGVEAYGVDVSEYAISCVREDIKPYCWVGSLVDPFPRRYDLIVCIEVLEHLSQEEGAKAIENLTQASDDILVSSTPEGYAEPTHFNVQPPEYWARMFTEHDFLHDVEFDASFISAWAMRFRKRQDPLHRVIVPFERKLWLLSRQVTALRDLALETKTAVSEREEALAHLRGELAGKDGSLSALKAELAARDDAVAGLNGELAARDQAIAALTTQLTEKGQMVEAARARIVELERAGQGMTAQMEEKNRALLDLQGQIRDRDRKIDVLSSEAAQNSRENRSLADLVAEKERAAKRLQAALTSVEKALREQQRRQQDLELIVQQKDVIERRLARIEGRLTFRALESIWRAQMHLAPPESPPGKLWFAFTRGARRALGQPSMPPEAGDAPGAAVARADTPMLATFPPAEGSGATTVEERVSEPPYHSYLAWARRCEEVRYNRGAAVRAIERSAYQPVISIVMPVYNTTEEYLRRAVDSVRQQYYPHWELCICDDASPSEYVRQILRAYAAEDGRIKTTFCEVNGGIAVASNRALALATGDFVGLLDHDDELTPDALYEVVAALQDHEADFIYSDEDKLDAAGRRCDPAFKPAWSPDLLLSCMYTSHFGVYRKRILDEIGGFRVGFDGSQDYDLALRFTEKTSRIVHVPKILYHWRQLPGSAALDAAAKPYAYDAARRALVDALQRRGIAGTVERERGAGFYRVKRAIERRGKVSIVIPTRDRLDLLFRCVESIESNTDYDNYEICIVDNGSREPAMLGYLRQTPHRVLRDDSPFNFSRLNNMAAREVDGEYLLLLNDDTEPLLPGWLSALVEQAQRPEVGAVGAKLLYPDDRIQHAGVILGLGGVASHAHKFVDARDCGYLNYPNIIRNYSAVTGACLMMRRDLFLELGGLVEDLPVGFNDTDLCLRLGDRGFLIAYTPYSVLRHRESASRPLSVDPREEAYMTSKWGAQPVQDPYYNPCLTLMNTTFALDYAKPDGLFCTGWQSASEEIIGPMYRGRTVGQEFVAAHNDLCAVGVAFATYGKKCQGMVRFRLRTAGWAGEEQATVETDAAAITDNELYIFSFDPIPDSAGQRFSFSVDFVPATDKSELTIYKSSNTDERFGPYMERDIPATGTLTFRWFTPARLRTAPLGQMPALSSALA